LGTVGAASHAAEFGAIGAGVGALKARKRIKRQQAAGVSKAVSVDDLFKTARAY
jgi:hypothetical protein